MRPAGAASDRPSESIAGRAARASERSTVDAILVASEDPHVSSTVLLSSCRDRTCNVQNPTSAVLLIKLDGRCLPTSRDSATSQRAPQRCDSTICGRRHVSNPHTVPSRVGRGRGRGGGRARRPRAVSLGPQRPGAVGRGLGDLEVFGRLTRCALREPATPDRRSGGRAADGTAPYGYFQTSGRRASDAASPRPS